MYYIPNSRSRLEERAIVKEGRGSTGECKIRLELTYTIISCIEEVHSKKNSHHDAMVTEHSLWYYLHIAAGSSYVKTLKKSCLKAAAVAESESL